MAKVILKATQKFTSLKSHKLKKMKKIEDRLVNWINQGLTRVKSYDLITDKPHQKKSTAELLIIHF